jgi:hypothetical protein
VGLQHIHWYRGLCYGPSEFEKLLKKLKIKIFHLDKAATKSLVLMVWQRPRRT